MQIIKSFNFQESAVRIFNEDGDLYFVAADIAGPMGYGNTAHMLRMIDDEDKGIRNVDTLGGRQQMLAINESGLYQAILKSRKPEAKVFKRWVTNEVLPALRKTGKYEVSAPATPALPDFSNPAAAARAWADQFEKAQTLSVALTDAQPALEFHKAVGKSTSLHTVTDVAKMIGLSGQALYKLLRADGIIFQGQCLPIQAYIDAGYFEVKLVSGDRDDGTQWTGTALKVTASGVEWLVGKYGIKVGQRTRAAAAKAIQSSLALH